MSYGETRLGQGRERSREFLKENPDMAKEIEEKVLDKLLPSRQPEAMAEAAADAAAPGREAPVKPTPRTAKMAEAEAASGATKGPVGNNKIPSRKFGR